MKPDLKSFTLPPALAQARAEAVSRWRALAPRERRLVNAALGVLAFALVWLLFVQPAWRTLREAPAQIEAIDTQLQQMQRLAAESRELRGQPVVSASMSEAALRSATERLGSGAKISMQGDRAVVTLNAVAGDALGAWLAEVRSGARARPLEAQLTRSGEAYNGTVTLALARPS
jgi:general secretion pathway protein M